MTSIMFGGIIMNAYGDSVDEMHDSAYEFMKMGKFAEAIEMYTKILEIEEYDETALLNRAVAFANSGNEESSLNDFSLVLTKDSENLIALNGKAIILSEFECESYNNCGPLQSLQIFEKMIELDPDNDELKLKRNFMFNEGLSNIPRFSLFDVRETNGEYIVNIQQIVRDKDGKLVSVIENAGTDISPTHLTEKFLDDKEKDGINFKKEIVQIGEDEYTKWYYETIMSDSEEERKFFGAGKSHIIVPNGEENGREMLLRLNIITALFPAVNVDIGDSTIIITEVFKKI